MIDDHREALHFCFADYSPVTVNAYACVLDGVFE
jgi:hypothetical protein